MTLTASGLSPLPEPLDLLHQGLETRPPGHVLRYVRTKDHADRQGWVIGRIVVPGRGGPQRDADLVGVDVPRRSIAFDGVAPGLNREIFKAAGYGAQQHVCIGPMSKERGLAPSELVAVVLASDRFHGRGDAPFEREDGVALRVSSEIVSGQLEMYGQCLVGWLST